MIPHESSPSPCLATLDRLPWADGFAVQSHGVAIGVRSDAPPLLEALRAQLLPSFQPVDAPTLARVYSLLAGGPDPARRGVLRLHLGFCGAGLIARARTPEALLASVGADLHRCVAETTTAYTFVHAGAVAIGDAALLVPGRSMAGKSTLIHALLAEGARYLSDEYAVLDADGRVHLYPTPIGMRLPELDAATTADDRALPVRWVVVTSYRHGATFRPRVLTPGQTALALLANTVRARSRPDASLAVISRACREARGVQSARGEARAAARAILAAIRGAWNGAQVVGGV